MGYSYDRRVASTATPSFDAVVRTDLGPKLRQNAAKATKVADKAEDLQRKARSPLDARQQKAFESDVAGVLRDADQVAYKTLDALRPVLSKGKQELSEVTTEFDALRDARSLVQELSKLDGLRMQVQVAAREPDMSTIPRLLHELAMSCVYVNDFYRQLRNSYGH